ncbi:MAG: MFS transporter [Asticcacaulis sp.]
MTLAKPLRYRFVILMSLFTTVVINYLDRSNLSVAALGISKDFHLHSTEMGLIFSAFAWSYTSLQIPGGLLADSVRPRFLYGGLILAWSIVTFLQGFIWGAGALIACRILIGIFEAPGYPINNKIVTSWFPTEERASAIAFYTSGQFIGLAFLSPILIMVQAVFGWRELFIGSGIIGAIWAVLWILIYRDRDQMSKTPSPKDVALSAPEKKEAKAQWLASLRIALSHKTLWGIYLGQFCLGTTTIFFLTWFPTYLIQYRGLNIAQSGILTAIPFLAAFFGVLLSGFTSDYMVKRGVSAGIARKGPIILGMLLSSVILLANMTNNDTLAILLLSIAFFGNGLASINWVFVSLVAPQNAVGTVGGVFNLIGGLSAVLTPIIIGTLIEAGDFTPALIYMGIIALIGVCSYIFLVGKVEQISV